MNSGMQNKTIRKVLKNKIEDWLNSIEGEDADQLRRMIKRDVIVTGGSIASMIMGEKVNDFDVYFRTKETTLAVAKYYVEQFIKLNPCAIQPEVREVTLKNIKGKEEERVVIWVSSAGVASEEGYETEDEADEIRNDEEIVEDEDDDGKQKYRPVFLSENAVTLSHKMQVVTRFYGEPEQIHDNYDFVHAKCYWTYRDDELVTPVEALRSMQSRVLKYEGSLYPICSIFRTRKFIARGWKISAGEMLKMCLQIAEIDLKDFRVLHEQLTGVDQLYFNMVISAIENKQDISSEYLIEIIDRVFSDN